MIKKLFYIGSILIMVLALLADILFRCLPCLQDCGFYSNLDANDGSTINISSLIAAALTVFSFMMGLSKEKVYGLSLNRIRDFLKKKYFDLKTVLIIDCAILITSTLANFFNLKFVTMVVEVIAVIIFLIFSVQQFKLINNKKEIAIAVIKNKIKGKDYNDLETDFEKEKYKNDFIYLLQIFMLNEGIEYLFLNLKKDNPTKRSDASLICFLMKKQINYFKNALNAVSIDNITKQGEDIEISKTIKNGYKNIQWVYKYVSRQYYDFNIDDIYELLSNNCVILHKLAKKNDLLDIESEFYDYIFKNTHDSCKRNFVDRFKALLRSTTGDKKEKLTKLKDDISKYNEDLLESFKPILHSIENNQQINKVKIDEYEMKLKDYLERSKFNVNFFLFCLTLMTIKDDDVWFLEYLLQNENQLLLSDDDYLPFTFLTTYMIIFLLENAKEKESTSIYKFINANRLTNNLFEMCWSKSFVYYIQTSTIHQILKLHKEIFEFYGLIKNYLHCLNFGNLLEETPCAVFNINDIYKNLFECLDINGTPINNQDVHEFFDSMNEEYKKSFSSFINIFFDINGEKKFEYSLEKYFKCLNSEKGENKFEYYETFFEILNSYQINKYTKYIEDKNRSFVDIPINLSNNLGARIKKLSFYDESLKDSEKTIDFDAKIKVRKSVNFYEFINKRFDELVIAQVENEINKQKGSIKQIKNSSTFTYDSNVTSTIKKMKISYASCIGRIPNTIEDIKDTELFKKDLKTNFLYSDFAIRFCVDINENCFTISEPDEEFLNSYIKENYGEKEREFYRYAAEDNFSFYVDKGGLLELLKKEYCYIEIKFKYVFIIESNKCLFVDL